MSNSGLRQLSPELVPLPEAAWKTPLHRPRLPPCNGLGLGLGLGPAFWDSRPHIPSACCLGA